MSNTLHTGRIIKGIAGFYYVYNDSFGVVECHAKGILRKGKYRPLVGDTVDFETVPDSEGKLSGSILAIHERHSSLIRPEVANVDQALVVFAYESPEPNIQLLDRFLIMLERQGVDCIICFNKLDIVSRQKRESILDIYKNSGYPVIEVSAKANEGIEGLRQLINGKITAFAGPSGVGKSSLINLFCPEAFMETGEISQKTERGKHTTRHSELFHVEEDTYIMDTPGFTALELMEGMEAEELRSYYKEFYEYEGQCKYDSCSHTHEPSCAVKQAVEGNMFSQIRYDNYCYLYDELRKRRKY